MSDQLTSPSEPIKKWRVFVSYSHDSAEHIKRVASFVERLRRDDVDVHCDQDPDVGDVDAWIKIQITEADFVLLVCTAPYKERFEGSTPAQTGNVRREALFITQELKQIARRAHHTAKFVPVLFGAEEAGNIPAVLSEKLFYQYPDSYPALLGHLKRRNLIKIGPDAAVVLRDDATRQRRRTFKWWALSLFCVFVFASLNWPLLVAPEFPVSGLDILLVRPLATWPATVAATTDLCARLRKLAPQSVACELTPLIRGRAYWKAKASAAHMQVVAFMAHDGSLTIEPLQTASPFRLPVDEFPSVRLDTPDSRAAATEAMVRINQILAGRLASCPQQLPTLDAGPELALQGLLLSWLCQGGRAPSDSAAKEGYTALLRALEEKLCVQRWASACELTQYLSALDCPVDRAAACLDTLVRLRALQQGARDRRLRRFAAVELARRLCDSSPAESARLVVDGVRSSWQTAPCDALLFLPAAGCLLSRPDLAPEERLRLSAVDSDTTYTRYCSAAVQADVNAERGFYQFRRHDYGAARKSLEKAHRLSPTPERALDLAEALLLEHQESEVRHYVALSKLPAEKRTHAAFILWLASRSAEDAWTLLSSFESLPLKQQGVFDAAHTLREYVRSRAPADAALEILLAPKSTSSVAALRAVIISSPPTGGQQ